MAAVLGRYEILEEIGRGGMSRVVKARDVSLLRLVAIKLVPAGSDSSFNTRMEREARATALLSHPNIVTIYDVGRADEFVYIVMEYVSGDTLETRMEYVSPAEWGRFLPAVAQCGDALDFAHRKGIVHRDIKPSNIMIGHDAVPKILDFGIAKIAADREMSSTKAGFLLGTPRFMAPEQAMGRPAGPQTDQYAVALIAYNLLAGSYPFSAESTQALLHQVVLKPPPPPSTFNPSLSQAVDRVILKALSKEPGERFGSCGEFFEALSRAAVEEAETTEPETGIRAWLKRIFGPSAPAEPTPAKTPTSPQIQTPKGARSPVVGAPGSASPTIAPPQPEVPASSSQPPGDFTALFGTSAPSPQPPGPPAPPPPPAEPGEFWKLFQTTPDIAPATPSPVPRPPAQSPGSPPLPPPGKPAARPGDFTRVFEAAEQTLILRKAPEQRVDAETLARAQTRELNEMLERRDFESAVALRGKWLPGIEGAPGELVGFSEAARYLGAAQDAVSPHVRIEHLKRAEKVLFSVGNQLLADTTPASRHLPAALEAWKLYARELLAAAQQKAATELPNPFRAGQPLAPDQGRAVFRGRNALVRRIEAILADADQNSSLALLGPRRCGKTSLLRMLPAMLPDCACVFFDLQDNPVSTVAEFFEALVRRAREQVRAQRRLELPALEGGATFESATRWFDQLDKMVEANRFLISIDEFERLEDLFPGDRRDLLRLMGLFRATIQHRRKVRLLVSGVAPFEELGSLWNDHFINVRELNIGHLDEETSIDLLCQPIPEFPAEAVPAEVARHVFKRTGGQPYLLQLFGTLLISRLNEMERSTATIADIGEIEKDALSQGRYYFGNTYQDAPPAAREVLESLAREESPSMAGSTRRWLERRWLINEDGGLRIPVLGAFIRDELG